MVGVQDYFAGATTNLLNSQALTTSPTDLVNSSLDSLGSMTSSNGAASKPGFYEVSVYSIRRDGETVNVKAFLPEEFAFDTESEYNAPFEKGLLSGTGIVGSIAQLAGYSLITQFLTQQLWQGSSPITFSLPLEFVARSDADIDVIDKILQLSSLCMPSDDKTGIMRSPGPVLKMTGEGGNRNLTDSQSFITGFGSTLGTIGKEFVVSSIDAFKNGGGLVNGATDAMKSMTNIGITKVIPGLENELGTLSKGMTDLSRYENVVQLKIGNFLHFDSVIVKAVRQTWTTQPDRNGKMMRAKADVTFSTHMTMTSQDLRRVFMK